MRIRIAAILAVVPFTALAQQSSEPGRIVSLRTGWNADSFGIVLTSATVNPRRCSHGDGGYVAVKTDPGYDTFYAAALTAYTLQEPIVVVADTSKCNGFNEWPKITGITLSH